jgi:hypothetical protein
MADWTDDIQQILEAIRINSVILSKEHKRRYFVLKQSLLYFRLPVIILSGLNSIISVGFQAYMKQQDISLITCLLALICSIIGSIELYLGINRNMELDLTTSRDYYLLSIDIFKCLNLDKPHRPTPAKEYLEKQYEQYRKLKENSNMLDKRLEDRLAVIPDVLSISKTNSAVSLPLPTKSDASSVKNDENGEEAKGVVFG